MNPETSIRKTLARKTLIRKFQPEDAPWLHRLIKQNFDSFVKKDLSPEGCMAFFKLVDRVLGESHRDYLTFTALQNNTPVGVLSLRENTHICLFFCDKLYMNRGIGRALLRYAQQMLVDKLQRDLTLTVNSSLFAVTIYQKMGFVLKGGVERVNGIRFQSMEKHLLVGATVVSSGTGQ